MRFVCFVFVQVNRAMFVLVWESKNIFFFPIPPLHDLRVEFLLKTDSGYARDAEVTLFTLANPGSSLSL